MADFSITLKDSAPEGTIEQLAAKWPGESSVLNGQLILRDCSEFSVSEMLVKFTHPDGSWSSGRNVSLLRENVMRVCSTYNSTSGNLIWVNV